MRASEYALFSFGTLFVIVDPFATVPAFLAMTPNQTALDRTRTARLASIATVGLLAAFSLIGQPIFQLMGISLPALQVAGGLVLLLIALDMLRAQRSPVQETPDDTVAGTSKHDIAITPLAIPMLAGPAAISSVILLSAQARGWVQHIILLGSILAVGVASYAVLALAAHGTRWMTPIAERILARVMGLLLAALAVQFIFNAFREIGVLDAVGHP
ncbi:MAG: MarC family protein [Nitrospiraceae bacterium]